jgi:signal transduction histidine kinase
MSSGLWTRVSGLRSRIAATIEAGVTDPPLPRLKWQKRGRLDLVLAADIVIAIVCFWITAHQLAYAGRGGGGTPGAAVDLLVAFVLCAPVALRSFLPLTSWSVCLVGWFWASRVVAAASALSISSNTFIPGMIVYGLCLYAVGVRCKTWVALSAGGATVLVAVFFEGQNFTVATILTAIAVFAGLIVRSQRSGRQQLEVAEQRHSGERALLQERQRIARELHDVVAHHMSVIAIQAEAAPYKVPDPPPELVESFADIRASALSGLSELRRVLGVLRSEVAEIAPQPGLGDLAGLIDSARTGGVTVTSSVTGTLRPLPEGVDLSAYRIVQEALSNAMRHAPGSAVQVKLYYGEAALVIEVRNDRCPDGAGDVAELHSGNGLRGGGGHGIIGMRERAAMLGGNLQAGPTGNGEFLVTAALPLGGAAGSGPAPGDGEPEDPS